MFWEVVMTLDWAYFQRRQKKIKPTYRQRKAVPWSQSFPLKPALQMQVNVPSLLTHVPSFLQGVDSHSSMSKNNHQYHKLINC